MDGWLNIASLLLPIVNLTREKKKENKNWAVLSIISISACSFSLCLQILNTYHLVTVEDWGALMDTMYAVAFASAILLLVTIILNGITLNIYRGKPAK